MKHTKVFLLFFLLISSASFFSSTFAQSEPVLYFCEKYGSNGEVGVSDRFTKGYLTVMVKCDDPLHLTDVTIQFDKYNYKTGKFDYYKDFAYTVQPDMNYIYFSKNADSDMKFEDTGLYRVFLLDEDGKTVASALIEIVN